jgi:transposase-like protein
MENPHHGVFCPNPVCPATGQIGEGNIEVHSRNPERYRCHVCQKTFGARRGSPFYRRRTPEATIVLVITLVAHGCPIAAIEAAFGLQRRTVHRWVDAAGHHCERIHEHLAHVQADELRVKTQGGTVWMGLGHHGLDAPVAGESHKSYSRQGEVRVAGVPVAARERWSGHLRKSVS